MELGDRVYAAERITKKREKRVSIVRGRLQMALPGGIRPRAVTAPSISPFSYLAPLVSCFFFFVLSFADSRLRAAAASSTTLNAFMTRDIGHYVPTDTGPLLPGYTMSFTFCTFIILPRARLKIDCH